MLMFFVEQDLVYFVVYIVYGIKNKEECRDRVLFQLVIKHFLHSVCLQRHVFKFFFMHYLFASFLLFLAQLLLSRLVILSRNFIAYWPIVIILTEHSLSSYSGLTPANAGICQSSFCALE